MIREMIFSIFCIHIYIHKFIHTYVNYFKIFQTFTSMMTLDGRASYHQLVSQKYRRIIIKLTAELLHFFTFASSSSLSLAYSFCTAVAYCCTTTCSTSEFASMMRNSIGSLTYYCLNLLDKYYHKVLEYMPFHPNARSRVRSVSAVASRCVRSVFLFRLRAAVLSRCLRSLEHLIKYSPGSIFHPSTKQYVGPLERLILFFPVGIFQSSTISNVWHDAKAKKPTQSTHNNCLFDILITYVFSFLYYC